MFLTKKFHALIFSVLLITLFCFSQFSSLASQYRSKKDGVYRAIWIDSYNHGFLNRSEAQKLISDCRKYNINTVTVEIRKLADAYYKSKYEPRATNIDDSPDYDPLQHIIKLAHDTSDGKKYIEVHAWFVIYKVMDIGKKDLDAAIKSNPNHIVAKHPEWITQSYDGKKVFDGKIFFDPGVPAVIDYTISVIMDVVKNYDIDGVNFDYIRYPGKEWGYNKISLKRFQKLYERQNKPEPDDRLWSRFRREQVTAFLKKVYITIISEKPNVVVSADTTSWGTIHNENFEATAPYASVFQDWQHWMSEHILDINARMGYKREHIKDQAADFRKWTAFSLKNQHGRIALIGQGAYLNSIKNSLRQIRTALDMGAKGFILYSYNKNNSEEKPREEFFIALKKWICTEWVYPPALEWKINPQEGIIKGIVKDARFGMVDSAKMTLKGTDSKISFTDGTGFYAFTNLKPGKYSLLVTVSANQVREVKNIKIKKGQIRNIDFEF